MLSSSPKQRGSLRSKGLLCVIDSCVSGVSFRVGLTFELNPVHNFSGYSQVGHTDA